MQILFCESFSLTAIGHWICVYYNKVCRKIWVYDSLNTMSLSRIHKRCIQILYPFIDLESDVVFKRLLFTQASGIFASANAISLVLGKDPSFIRFKLNSDSRIGDEAIYLRRHIAQIFREKILSCFPVDFVIPKGFSNFTADFVNYIFEILFSREDVLIGKIIF